MAPADLSSTAASLPIPDNTYQEHEGHPSSWRQGTTAPVKWHWDPNSNPSHEQVHANDTPYLLLSTVSKIRPFLAFHTSHCSKSQGKGLPSSKSLLTRTATCHTTCTTVP